MALVVQKYGGSSVADAARIKNVAGRIAASSEEGNQVVVVVSAMGDTTDRLIELVYQVTERPDVREFDTLLSTGELVSSTLLAMTLKEMGYSAISLSGAQAGIKTDSAHSRARIREVESMRVTRELEKGNIVIVAGFQGVTDEMDVTTLGRGGSDTTAVALAASLGAGQCQIYTDVDGVYTADPSLIPEARPMPEIGYDEMLELATYGTRVMHSRAVELGELYDIPILVKSSFSYGPGTLIHGGVSSDMEVRNKVRGVAYDLNVAKITVTGVSDKPGIASSIFQPLASAGISVDTIVQNVGTDRVTDLTFTVAKSDLDGAMRVVEPIAKSVRAKECIGGTGLGKVSVVGTGMQNTPGYAARMFEVLSREGINIQMISTSEIRITCIINESEVKAAVKALHRAFELEVEDEETGAKGSGS